MSSPQVGKSAVDNLFGGSWYSAAYSCNFSPVISSWLRCLLLIIVLLKLRSEFSAHLATREHSWHSLTNTRWTSLASVGTFVSYRRPASRPTLWPVVAPSARLAKSTACNHSSALHLLLVGLLLSGDVHCNPGPFRLQYFNARSLLNKIPELQSDLGCNPADAVCVSETWLGDSVRDHEILGPEYAVFRKDRRGRGGGVLIAVKHEFSPTRRADLESPNSELVWTQLNCRGGKLLLGSLYRPPTSGHGVFSELCEVFDRIGAQGDPFMNIILTGDFNLHINWNSADPIPTNDTEAKFLDWMQYANLTQVVRFPTHIHGNKLNHTLDLVLCRNPALLQSVSETPPLSNSDHIGISSSWHLGCTGKRFVSKQVLLFNRDGRETLERSVAAAPWFLCMDFLSDYNPWDLFYDMFSAACKDSTYSKLTSMNKKFKPWITGPIRKSSNKTKRLFRKAVKSQDPQHWSEYKHLLRSLKKEIRVSYQRYLCDIASQARTCPKRFWQFFGSQQRNSTATQLHLERGLSDNPQDIANSFGEYFSEVVPSLDNPCPTPGDCHSADCHSTDQRTRLQATPVFDPPSVQADEVESAICKLKNSASPGPDGIPPLLLKACAPAISLHLVTLYN